MADSSPPPSSPPSPAPATTITDLNEDSIGHCATNLTLRDVCNLAMSSTALKRLAYSDSVWHHLFKDRWHREISGGSGTAAREAYISRYNDLQQFKFTDPFVSRYNDSKRFNHLLLHQNNAIFAQGSSAGVINFDDHQKGAESYVQTMSDHKARITCMRLFSLGEQNVVVTSSCDHSIRLWWKDSCLRCLRGHNGPVLSLSNKLLGEDGSKVLASGGEDGTVRLWSLSSSGKRGQRALKATLYGHEKPVNLMSVSGHKTSLLVTIARDSKVRVWDTTTSSSARSSCCVGTTSVTGTPINMKCHESLVHVASGSAVTAVDLRTMQRVITAAVHQPKLYSFGMAPSKSLICTGGNGRAMLWDIRRNQELLKPKPVAELDGHSGPVTNLHMDSYKIVTGGPDDTYVNVWEVGTGEKTNSLLCCLPGEDDCRSGCDAMAVNGCRILTASYCNRWGVLTYWDFNNATSPVTKLENEPPTSKFWDSQSDNNSDDD
ncbi:U4/U6 small nuclear ribonucleoprotein PRP4 [Trifolium repens]|nr:U4/U6 small nuclear ribonucleoprotein PRP4 [Trifolium repens]